jgi:hypothetical protein
MVLRHNFYKDLYDILVAELAAEKQQSQLLNFMTTAHQGYAQHGLWYAEVIPGKFDESGEPQLALRQFDRRELAKKYMEIDLMFLQADGHF